jgi:hypothetical protein
MYVYMYIIYINKYVYTYIHIYRMRIGQLVITPYKVKGGRALKNGPFRTVPADQVYIYVIIHIYTYIYMHIYI